MITKADIKRENGIQVKQDPEQNPVEHRVWWFGNRCGCSPKLTIKVFHFHFHRINCTILKIELFFYYFITEIWISEKYLLFFVSLLAACKLVPQRLKATTQKQEESDLILDQTLCFWAWVKNQFAHQYWQIHISWDKILDLYKAVRSAEDHEHRRWSHWARQQLLHNVRAACFEKRTLALWLKSPFLFNFSCAAL